MTSLAGSDVGIGTRTRTGLSAKSLSTKSPSSKSLSAKSLGAKWAAGLGALVLSLPLLAAFAVPATAGASTAARASSSPAKHSDDREDRLSWRLLPTGSNSHFRGLSAVSAKVAWVGGYDGTILRTVDGGRTWLDASPRRSSWLTS